MKLRKGNVFISMCQEFCSQGGQVHTPLGRQADPPGRCAPPWADAPPWQTPTLGQTPPPPHRRLLQKTVCILLECILVLVFIFNKFGKSLVVLPYWFKASFIAHNI